jgi:hypothetical protein
MLALTTQQKWSVRLKSYINLIASLLYNYKLPDVGVGHAHSCQTIDRL